MKILEAQTKDLAPIDTGFLRASIFSRIKKAVGIVATRISYAFYQEEGTPGGQMDAANQGKGFMKPAAGFVKSRLSAIFGREIRSGFRSN